jgi:hypothetical protein
VVAIITSLEGCDCFISEQVMEFADSLTAWVVMWQRDPSERERNSGQVIGQPSALGYRTQIAQTRWACWAVIVVWAMIAAAGAAYMYLWSTQPVTEFAGTPPPWGPAWAQSIGYLVALAGMVWRGVLIVLLVLGVFHLRRAIHTNLSWVIAWIGAVGAGMVLEVLYFLGPALTDRYPAHVGDVTVRPEFRWLAAGFLIVGAALLAVLTAAGLRPRHEEVAS